jgi:photosystem II stability/assembly factor-like uncharacterized protein
MKKSFPFIILQFTVLIYPVISQWQLRHPSVPPASISDIVFVSDHVGFCSTLNAIIYKTFDKGASWTEVARAQRDRIHSIVFSDSLNVVAILPHGYIGDQLNIMQTSDGGTTWVDRFIPVFNEFSISTRISNTLFSVRAGFWLMSSYHGEIRTSRDLENWKSVFRFGFFIPDDVPLPIAIPSSFVALQNSRVLALANKWDFQRYRGATDSISIILTSDTSCSHWDTLWVGAHVPLYSMCFADTMKGWAVGEQGTILKTTDGGHNWSSVHKDSMLVLKYVTAVDTQRIYAVSTQNEILISVDGGQTWKEKPANVNSLSPKALFLDKDIGFLTANSGLPLRTTDGGETWIDAGASPAEAIRKIEFVSLTTGWAVGSGKVFKTTNGGSTWKQQDSVTLSNISSIEMIDSLTGWATGLNTAYKTGDGGNVWKIGFSDPTILYMRGINFFDARLGAIAEARTNNNDAYNYITTDSGKTWTAYKMPESVSSYPKVQFSDYRHGWLVEQGEVWKTLDTGKTWKRILTDSTYYPGWAFDFIDSLHGWFISNKVWFTTDGGSTWNTSALPYWDQSEDIHFISRLKGYAVGYYGSIMSTTDGGWTWKADAHPSSVPLFSLSEFRNDNTSHVWVGGDSFVIEYTSTPTTRVVPEKVFPTDYVLEQNYPNPFNPATEIQFAVKERGNVDLRIYDVLGREVKSLLSERMEVGTHKVMWDGRNRFGNLVSTGVYFYRLVVNDFVSTKRMILLK